MKAGKEILEFGKEILVELGVHTVLKEQAAQALKVHFAGIGKNDERIFATDLLCLDAAERQTTLDFFADLEDWQQIQFILFVAGMEGATVAQPGKKGQPPTATKPGSRQPFLKGLAALDSHQERINYLEILHVFSPISISRVLAEINRRAKGGLRASLQGQGWQPDFNALKDAGKRAAKKVSSWRNKLAEAIEKATNKGGK